MQAFCASWRNSIEPGLSRNDQELAEIGGVDCGDLDGHLLGARLRGAVADRRSVAHGALARNGAGGVQETFEKGRLTAEIRPDECYATATGS